MKTECSKENIKMTVWLIAIFLGTKITSGKCLYSLNTLMLSSVLNNNLKKTTVSSISFFSENTNTRFFGPL